jgi:hypothetical protein
MSDEVESAKEFERQTVESIFPVFAVNVPMPKDTAVPGSYKKPAQQPAPGDRECSQNTGDEFGVTRRGTEGAGEMAPEPAVVMQGTDEEAAKWLVDEIEKSILNALSGPSPVGPFDGSNTPQWFIDAFKKTKYQI